MELFDEAKKDFPDLEMNEVKVVTYQKSKKEVGTLAITFESKSGGKKREVPTSYKEDPNLNMNYFLV